MTARPLTPTEATALQTALNKTMPEGVGKLVLDGHFGELSHLALIRFQHDHPPLLETGNPDPATLAELGIPDLFTPPAKPKGLNIVQASFLDYIFNLLTSKIGWAAAAMVAVAVTWINTRFGFNVPPEMQNLVTGLLVSGFGALIMLLRGWFNAPKVATKQPEIVVKK